MPFRRNLVIGLLLSRLQVFWKWARRDSNPRPTDYESLTARRVRSSQLAFLQKHEVRSGCRVPGREILGNHGVVAIQCGTTGATSHASAPTEGALDCRRATPVTRMAAQELARKLARGVCCSLDEHSRRVLLQQRQLFQIWLYKAT